MRLIVFDLDGTLIDSRQDLADATNQMIQELGGTPLPVDAVALMVGEGAPLLVRRALEMASLHVDPLEALGRFLNIYESRLLVHTRPYAGTMEMLAALAGRYHLAVLTNKPSPATREILNGLGLAPWFSDVIGGDTPFRRKPDPAGLYHLVSQAQATPATTMFVGDSAIDLETARRARTNVCLARYGFGYRFNLADFDGTEHFIDEPQALIPLIGWLSAAE
jgi:phosphoglycolate phosphatase